MKETLKRIVCVFLSFMLIFSVASCGDDDKKSACELHTEEFMNIFLARKYRLVHVLTDLDDSYIDAIKKIAADEYIDAVMEHASYTVDKDTIKEKSTRASCTCILRIPDYEKAYTESDGTLEGFSAKLNELTPEEYMEIKFEIRFRIEDGYWVVTKSESIYQDLYVKMIVVLVEKKLPVISDEKLGDSGIYFIIPAQSVTLDSFKTALKVSGDDAYKDMYEGDKIPSGSDKHLLAYAYSADDNTLYEFFSYSSLADASKCFSEVYNYTNPGDADEKNKKDNWGFFVAHYSDGGAVYWFWYENSIVCVETKNESASKKSIYRFFSALNVTG